jgi:lipopolysaccharide export system protein LptA
VRKVILSAVIVSVLAAYGHAQTAVDRLAYSISALRIQKSGNTLTLTGEVVIKIDGFEIKADSAVLTLPPQSGK